MSKRKHSGRETTGGGANDVSQGNKLLLVGPRRGVGAQFRDPLKAARSRTGGLGAAQDGMCEVLRSLGAQWTGCVSVRGVP